MAKERRDSKNRLLGRGEYQKEDGRYMYRYIDANGKARFVYSWTLTKTDRTPAGKTPGPCLRDMIVQITKDVNDEIDTYNAKKSTVNDYFEKYLSQKKKLRQRTRQCYRSKYNLYAKGRIGNKKIYNVKFSDICKCYAEIIEECKISSQTLYVVDVVLKALFQIAIRDGLIRANPVEGAFESVSGKDSTRNIRKETLTSQQTDIFLDFIRENNVYKKWENLYIVMLGTGCRVGEICGLIWDDCDFENNTIRIERSLSYYPEEYTGKYSWTIHEPKTECGKREIPMLPHVRSALLEQKKHYLKNGFCVSTVDGVSGFVFCNSRQGVLIPNEVNKTLTRIVRTYNKYERKKAELDGRDSVLLPDFTPHTLRHTFCTRLCEAGVDIKVVQEIMGHSTISVTMDIYNNLTEDYKVRSMKKVDNIFKTG